MILLASSSTTLKICLKSDVCSSKAPVCFARALRYYFKASMKFVMNIPRASRPSSVSPGAPTTDTEVSGEPAIDGSEMLESWHQCYIAMEGNNLPVDCGVIQALTSDKLDYAAIELQVQQLLSAVDVVQGFCGACRRLLDRWPNLYHESIGISAYGRPVRTIEVEAAARAGCNFCGFMLSRLVRKSLLDTFRRIEIRLHNIGDKGTASLSMQNWGLEFPKTQLLWLNFPQKTANHFYEVGEAPQFISHIVSPTSEPDLFLRFSWRAHH